MAAVICNLCSGCGGLFSNCGECLCLPCKACGMGCSSLCEAISSPFFPYLLVTFGLNFPPFILAIQSVDDLANGCATESTWMLVSGGFALVHMIASLYIIKKIQEDTTTMDDNGGAMVDNGFVKVENEQPILTAAVVGVAEPSKMESGTAYEKMSEAKAGYGSTYDDKMSAKMADGKAGYAGKAGTAEAIQATVVPGSGKKVGTTTTTTTTTTTYPPSKYRGEQGDGMTWSRIKQVLCYDKGVAIYIVLAVIWVFWQAAGVPKYFSHDGAQCQQVGSHMLTSLFCGWFYMALVGVAFLCSMCCLRL